MSRSKEHLKNVERINLDFQQFQDFCKKEGFTQDELATILLPLNRQLKIEKTVKWLKWVVVIAILVGAAFYVATFYNILSALGRIFLIKFVLPIWNWEQLYNADCFVELPRNEDNKGVDVDDDTLYASDCDVCEGLDGIDRIEDISYSQLNTMYLQRGIPVVINDSPFINDSESITRKLLYMNNILSSTPCNLETNLMMHRFANLEDLIDLANKNEISGWFLHFRNCKFDAIKESRLLWHRPYYLGAHLEPFYSSWIIMSSTYGGNAAKILDVQDLVQVIQLEGDILVQLVAKGVCYKICGDHEIVLEAGQTVVFLADLWEFQYFAVSAAKSVSFVTETHWIP